MTSKCLDNYEEKAPRWPREVMRVKEQETGDLKVVGTNPTLWERGRPTLTE